MIINPSRSFEFAERNNNTESVPNQSLEFFSHKGFLAETEPWKCLPHQALPAAPPLPTAWTLLPIVIELGTDKNEKKKRKRGKRGDELT